MQIQGVVKIEVDKQGQPSEAKLKLSFVASDGTVYELGDFLPLDEHATVAFGPVNIEVSMKAEVTHGESKPTDKQAHDSSKPSQANPSTTGKPPASVPPRR